MKHIKEKIEKHLNKAFCYNSMVNAELGCVYNSLVLKGFEYEPHLSLCSGTEVFLTYKGYELHIPQVITIMEEKGFIEPQDFHYTLTD